MTDNGIIRNIIFRFNSSGLTKALGLLIVIFITYLILLTATIQLDDSYMIPISNLRMNLQNMFEMPDEENEYDEKSDLNQEEFRNIPNEHESSSVNITDHIQNETSVHFKCSCYVRSIPRGDGVLKILNQNITFYNHTTKDELMKRHPNYPVLMTMEMLKNGKCDMIPHFESLNWKNTYWQETVFQNGEIFTAYSSTYDNRTATDIRPSVRILGTSQSTSFRFLPWCQFYFNSTSPPEITKARRIEYIDWLGKTGSRPMPFMLSCQIPARMAHAQPLAVGLVKSPCDQSRILLQVNGAGKREPSEFVTSPGSENKTYATAICGTALYFFQDDFSIRLVEWLEIMRSIGVSQVLLHETEVHPNIAKVLRYYEADGFVSVTKYSYPAPYENEPSARKLWAPTNRQQMWSQENIYFTDCLLRNMHKYRFIAHHDPDEIPTFSKYETYPEFLEKFGARVNEDRTKQNKLPPVAYRLKFRMFYADIDSTSEFKKYPEYFHVLRSVMRPRKDLGYANGAFKALYDMDHVTGVFSHNVLFCASGRCKSDSPTVNLNDAYLSHFKSSCNNRCNDPSSVVEDLNVVRDRPKLKEVITKVLNKLQLID